MYINTTITVIPTPQTHSISNATFTRGTSLSQVHHNEWDSHVFALKCFPVTLKEIMWLSRHYLTKFLHSFLFATESRERSPVGVSKGGEVLAVVHSLFTQLDMTQLLTSQKRTAQKEKKQTGSTMVRSTDQTQEISVLIGYVQQLNTRTTLSEMKHF